MRKYTSRESSIIKNQKKEKPHICYYCGGLITNEEELTVDHKTPLSRGGLTVPDNLVIACRNCNLEKDSMLEDEYYVYLEAKKELGNYNYKIINKINNMLREQEEILDMYKDLHKEKRLLNYKKMQVLKMITTEHFNAARGYMLARELQNYSLKIIKIDEELIQETSMEKLVKYNIMQLNTQKREIFKKLIEEYKNKDEKFKMLLKKAM
ncbi:HNH endonuclease [Clostridium felsineum]|uniref:HNH endonuclease n=1 Tax=Clostridium felsineum TaxID=36839 RepID=UPI00214DD7F0|nr:HNH endonuclease signature motif containing protein [Clostridium felsineum]MCR3761903.1 HNH endonuclease [Clostridium felsineum]